MKTIFNQLLCFAAAALLCGCAGGPRFSQVSRTLPPLGADQGRIYFYRTSALGAAVQPSVMLNGQKVGDAVPKGVYFVDRPAGDYKVTTTTEVSRSASFVLDKNQTRYIRLNISMGFFVGHVWPELIDAEKGEKEIQDCHYIGAKPN